MVHVPAIMSRAQCINPTRNSSRNGESWYSMHSKCLHNVSHCVARRTVCRDVFASGPPQSSLRACIQTSSRRIKSAAIVLLVFQPPMKNSAALLVASIVVSMLSIDPLSTTPCSPTTYRISSAFRGLGAKLKCQRSRSQALNMSLRFRVCIPAVSPGGWHNHQNSYGLV